MPDSPITAKWLSEREKTIAVKRLVDDQLGVKNSKSFDIMILETHRSDKTI